MLVEPMLSLAISMHADRGAYALFLGSGVSRAANIPTGWEMTLDLIRKLARMKGQHVGADSEAETWYKDTYGTDADYAQILEQVGKTPADRRAILRAYFEPTEEESARGEKLPTEAHKCIADLVSKGYVRVIVTTNFDHLIEESFRRVGIEPVVISTPDGIQGAPPLSRPDPLIIKAHGDYLDARIKNTPSELGQYDPRLDELLDRVFDEFGLIVCGWSATWDVAMRNVLERCKSHRLGTYWTERHSLSAETRRLVTSRRADIIKIESADSFFRELAEKILALEEINRPHPLEPRMAVTTLENYLEDARSEIRTQKLVVGETERLYERLVERNYPVARRSNVCDYDASEIIKRLQRYEADSEVLINLTITGCYWGRKEHEDLWWKSLERIANPPHDFSNPFSSVWYSLRKYPALLLLYGGGIAACTHGRHGTLIKLFSSGVVRESGEPKTALVIAVNPSRIISDSLPENVVREVFGGPSAYGVSNRLSQVLRDQFRFLLPQDTDYEDAFDRFEFFLALAYADIGEDKARYWTPIGRLRFGKRELVERLAEEAADAGADWPPLKAGFFRGSTERFARALGIAEIFYKWTCPQN